MISETRRVDADGITIHTSIAGHRDKPPLVLFHGYPTSSALWRRCLPQLANSFRLLIPDLPGHGQSDKPTDIEYNLDFYVHHLAAWADAMDLDCFYLAAHDLGALAALGLATKFEHRIGKLVIMNTAPFASWPPLCRFLLGVLRNRAVAGLFLRPRFFSWMIKIGVHNRQVISKEVAELYRSPWVVNSQSQKVFRLLISVPPERTVPPISDLRRISIPTLVLWAERDLLFGPKIARQLAEVIPSAELALVPNCGHFLPEENPRATTEQLCSFLERLSQPLQRLA